jgi:hypothetical protein
LKDQETEGLEGAKSINQEEENADLKSKMIQIRIPPA